jgi:hypothetical protein
VLIAFPSQNKAFVSLVGKGELDPGEVLSSPMRLQLLSQIWITVDASCTLYWGLYGFMTWCLPRVPGVSHSPVSSHMAPTNYFILSTILPEQFWSVVCCICPRWHELTSFRYFLLSCLSLDLGLFDCLGLSFSMCWGKVKLKVRPTPLFCFYKVVIFKVTQVPS